MKLGREEEGRKEASEDWREGPPGGDGGRTGAGERLRPRRPQTTQEHTTPIPG